MAATSPTYARSHDATAWNAADGGEVADYLTGLDDGNRAVGILKQGKSPDDILRVEFPFLTGLVNTNSVSAWAVGAHNYGTIALLPYDSATTVLTTNKITMTAFSDPIEGLENKFVLTTDFIGDLFDQDGSGTWAARIVEDLQISGDLNISEIESDLTPPVAGLFLPFYPRRPNPRLRM